MFRTFFEETKLHFISMKLATSILVKYCKGIVEMNTKYIPPHMWFLFTFIKQVLEITFGCQNSFSVCAYSFVEFFNGKIVHSSIDHALVR